MKAALFLAVCTLPLAACESASLKQAKQAAANELKDPASAQFRNVREPSSHFVCGEMNGKNSFGAYNGFRRFVWINGTVMVEDEVTNLDSLWKDCGK